MRTLIVFASKTGTSAECASQLAQKLDGEVSLCQLGKERLPSLDTFDRIVVGGSIRIGKIQKQVTSFVSQNKDILSKKPLGLFICCMADGETAEQYLKTSFTDELFEHAKAKGLFGGCYKFSRMGWLNRKMIQMVEKQQSGREISTSQDIDKTNPDAIDQFAIEFCV
jgi:menaquinone-dependent protoporphyrinogen oxidase